MSQHRNALIPDLTKVEIYWNFHRGLFSVKVDGKVVLHTKRAWIYSPVFKVSEAGRQRVLREKRKNVHAVIRGHWISPSRWATTTLATEHLRYASYNPYKVSSFVDEDGKPVLHAFCARLDAESDHKIDIRGSVLQ